MLALASSLQAALNYSQDRFSKDFEISKSEEKLVRLLELSASDRLSGSTNRLVTKRNLLDSIAKYTKQIGIEKELLKKLEVIEDPEMSTRPPGI